MNPLLKKLGFTLMEVNLAVFIMAAGVLAMVSLYPLGYRENQQSVDDVKAAAFADSVFNQIAAALNARSLTWDEWKDCVKKAVDATGASLYSEGGERGWARFCDTSRGYAPKDRGTINNISRSVFSALTAHATKAGFSPDDRALNEKNLTVALVAQWGMMRMGNASSPQEDHSRVTLSMRVARNSGALFAQPIFLTEIHFQGDQEEQINGTH